MYYICDHCHYVFSSEAFPHRCPDCGELAIRRATAAEKAEHLRMLRIVAADNWNDTAEYSLARMFKSGRVNMASAQV